MKKLALRSTHVRARTKRRNTQHLTDDAGAELLRSCLPGHWVLRPYRPDYGIDFSLELFTKVHSPADKGDVFETLGEHLFIQLKSTRSATVRSVKIFSRYNVEKKLEILDKNEVLGTMEVAVQRLESPELATIDRMGVATPVLLVIADIAAQRCYFVCLSDYIDKILIPRFGDRATSKSRSIEVPTENVLTPDGASDRTLRWYGKRTKLYAAFQRFVFQHRQLENEHDPVAIIDLARHFATRIAMYDLWEDTEMWEVIDHYGRAIHQFLQSGDAATLRLESSAMELEHERSRGSRPEDRAVDIQRLWTLFSHLPANYEDVCREWLVPTALGYLASYRNSADRDSFHARYTRPNR